MMDKALSNHQTYELEISNWKSSKLTDCTMKRKSSDDFGRWKSKELLKCSFIFECNLSVIMKNVQRILLEIISYALKGLSMWIKFPVLYFVCCKVTMVNVYEDTLWKPLLRSFQAIPSTILARWCLASVIGWRKRAQNTKIDKAAHQRKAKRDNEI